MEIISIISWIIFLTLRTNLDLVLEDLRDANSGYTLKVFLLNSKSYGLPQSRSRVYIVGIKSNNPELADPPDTVLANVHECLGVLQLDTVAAVLFLAKLCVCFVRTRVCLSLFELMCVVKSRDYNTAYR
jgi:site-specific DNA-cytosine methylase